MNKAEKYHQNAVKCRQKSEIAKGADEKALWLKIATEWLRMADEADKRPDAF